jgi:hypothetical protein
LKTLTPPSIGSHTLSRVSNQDCQAAKQPQTVSEDPNSRIMCHPRPRNRSLLGTTMRAFRKNIKANALQILPVERVSAARALGIQKEKKKRKILKKEMKI